MSVSQDIKYGPYDSNNINNPNKLYEFVKPSRIITGEDPPTNDIGQYYWYYIDGDGNLYYKDPTWTLIYNFNTGGTGHITDCINIGDGEGQVFKKIEASTIELRTLTGITELDKAKVQISTTDDIINLQTIRSINYCEDAAFTGQSLIDNIIFDSNNLGILSLRTIVNGSGVSVTENNGIITIANTAQNITKIWGSIYNLNPTTVISFRQGANITYAIQMPTTSTNVTGGLTFFAITGVPYFTLSGSLNKYFRIDYYCNLESSPALSTEQVITFVIQTGYDFINQPNSAQNLILYATPGVSGGFKNGSVSHSFTLELIPGYIYTLAIIPRSVAVGVTSVVNILNYGIILTEL